jgi:hypothetical protein
MDCFIVVVVLELGDINDMIRAI